MAIEIYATTEVPLPPVAADAACNVVVPGVPSSYTDDEDTREELTRTPCLP